ncbi:hypothetical protein BCh11DRAFT_06099 [Burkholderia sp. Ch1-1]|nr:hypothetical protein BCh11DRAFT_06099 [Burkholderia sp. Ch1-1]
MAREPVVFQGQKWCSWRYIPALPLYILFALKNMHLYTLRLKKYVLNFSHSREKRIWLSVAT